VTWLLFPFYYLPLVVAVVFIIAFHHLPFCQVRPVYYYSSFIYIYTILRCSSGRKSVYFKGVKKLSRRIKSIHLAEESTKMSTDYTNTIFGLDDLGPCPEDT